MHIPHTRYATWLAISLDADQLATKLDELSLPAMTVPQLADIVQRAVQLPLSPGLRRRLEKKAYSDQDEAIFQKLGFGEIYRSTYGRESLWEEIAALLVNPTLRVALESTLLADLKPHELSQMIQVNYKVILSERGIELYCKYFFDYKKLSRLDWREYLKQLTNDVYIYVRYQTALLQPQAETLHLVGLPSKPAFSQFLGSILSTAEYKFRRYSAQGSVEGDAAAQKWAKLGIEAGAKYEKFSSQDVTDFAATVQAEFQYIDSSIEQITGEMLSDVKPPSIEEIEKASVPIPPPLNQPETEV